MNLLAVIYRSTKTELKIVAIVLAVLFLLPLFSVVVIANAGVSEVVHALVKYNPITHLVEIHDANGKLVNQLQVSTVWPVNGVVTLEFGANDLPYELYHTGIDIANRHGLVGDPVTTFMDGKVIRAGWDKGCGNYVMVDHGSSVTSLYCHMQTTYAHKDQQVKPGDVLGLEGMTGHATGPHVHFEIKVYGVPVNPRLFMVGNPDPGP